jgi:large repetitive protein
LDFDDDGKPDFVNCNGAAASAPKLITALNNNSTPGSLVFPPAVTFSTNDQAGNIDAGDIDGDGKEDIIKTSWNDNVVSVYKNTSSVGNISFAGNVDFTTGLNPRWVTTGDIDMDGKADIVLLNINEFNLSVLRNTTVAANISFAPRINLPTGSGGSSILLRDIDGDTKTDIILTLETSNKLVIFRNTSSPGNISFEPSFEMSTGNRPYGVAVGDLDNDGKSDIVTANNSPGNISVFRNLSTPSSLSLASAITIPNGMFTQKAAIGDLDGDGKLDLAVTRADGLEQIVSVYKNTSSVGLISFATNENYALAGLPQVVTIGDIDGDNLPDISASTNLLGKISILRNTTVCLTAGITTQPKDTTVCDGTNAAFNIVATNVSSYQWQVNTGSTWVNIINSVVYSGGTTSTLLVTGATVLMNNFLYRCVTTNSCGSVNSVEAKLVVNTPAAPAINITSTSISVCQGTPVTFSATVINGGATPSFQWKKNNINTGSNAATYTDNSLVNGDIITCILTSNSNCITQPTASSNSILVTVISPLVPAISITASANNICYGSPVVFTATVANGGTAPSYQWKKNGINVGTNAAMYTDNSLVTGDVIICLLIPNISCITTPSVTSNQFVMNVQAMITPSITISASSLTICPGTPVNFTSLVTNGGFAPTYSWKKNGVIVGTNSPLYTDNTLGNGDIITCALISDLSSPCMSSNMASSNSLVIPFTNTPGSVNLGPDKSICLGSTLMLAPQPVYSVYTWQDGSSNNTFPVTVPGLYYVTVQDVCGNLSSDTVNIISSPTPNGFLPLDTAICSYESIRIKPISGYNKYLWSNNDTTQITTITHSGTYWLQVTDNNNCKGRDTIIIKPKNCFIGVYFPNAFTPNGDFKNDAFKPIFYANVLKYDLWIYNIYGELIFHSTDIYKGWDGTYRKKMQNSNTFVWVSKYQLENKGISTEKGTVILIR